MLEDLTKNQLILLTLLVSFVTSIATGIITFSLLQEAPAIVTRTIDRVVEKTIEKVSDGSSQGVREVTVVVQEEDQVIEAVSENAPSVVRIEQGGSIVGLGTLISRSGVIVAPAGGSIGMRARTYANLSDEQRFSLEYLGQDEQNLILFFKISPDDGELFTGRGVVLANENPQLGQTVIAIEGEDRDIVSIGRVSAFTYSDPKDPASMNGFETDIAAKSSLAGSPVFNLSGEFLGIRGVRNTSSGLPIYLPVNLFRSAIAEYSLK